MTSDGGHEGRLQRLAGVADEALLRFMGEALADAPAVLREAMFYAVFPGGKRIRPVLLLEVCRMCGGGPEAGLPGACAVELVHCYSLVHDDLPCMDDAKERRGRPALHVAFGEAVAVLAGDALLTLAFESLGRELLRPGLPPRRAEALRAAVLLLAKSSGAAGMAGGQAKELSGLKAGRGGCRRQALSPAGDEDPGEDLKQVISLKTGALFEFSTRAGALLGGGRPDLVDQLGDFGRHLGAAFQVADDLDDSSEDVCSLVTALGEDAAKRYGLEQAELALRALEPAGDEASFLRWVLEGVAARIG